MSIADSRNRSCPRSICVIRRVFTAIVCMSTVSIAPAQAQQHSLQLYDGPAPGSESWVYPEVVQKTATGEVVSNVRDPKLSAYLPHPSKATGAAAILLAGGAMRFLAFGRETDEIIARFNEAGIAVIVAKYRTLQADPAASQGSARAGAGAGATQAMLKNLAKMEIRNANANPDPSNDALNSVLRLAVADGQAALRLVRARAQEWKIDPQRVGMIGISAGGGVAIGTIVADMPGAAPDFFISLYGPSLQDVIVPKNAPPIFLATEANHGPVTKGLLALYSMWNDAGKSAELHVYDVANFSMTIDLWGDRALAWMKERKLLEPGTKKD